MYWDNLTEQTISEYALRDYLLSELGATDRHATEPDPVLRDVAHGVSIYCAQSAAHGLPSAELHAMLSRALWGVGRTDAAERMIADHVERRSVRRTLLALLRVGDVAPALWVSVVRGAIRLHEDWVSADGAACWVLDLTCIRATGCDMELARFQALRRLLTALASVWDATGGSGALAVRGAQPESATRELLSYVDAVFLRLQRERGWSCSPDCVRMA